ncbi:uncharacterized protein with HEPN domain [Bradyrhizobium sp. USDA 3311]
MRADVATVLQRLLMAGEAVLTLRDPGYDCKALHEEVMDWGDRAADRERVVHSYTVMCSQAVWRASETRHDRKGDIYRRLVGVLLPEIRSDFGKAIEQRNRPTP